MVISEGQTRVMQAIEEKMAKAIELYEGLVENANRSFTHQVRPFDKKILLPEFMQ